MLNYVGAFLTFSCNFRCSYCINKAYGPKPLVKQRAHMSGQEWIEALNRLSLPDDLPITLQGGEPSLHPDFYEIVAGIKPSLKIDLLTNLTFDLQRFSEVVSPERMNRPAPYAPIRVSWHLDEYPLEPLLERILFLKNKGFHIGLFAVNHPDHSVRLREAKEECQKLEIDFRLKEFLGLHKGQAFGTYHYPEGVFSSVTKPVMCRTNELLVAPDGHTFRCHRDLYLAENPTSHISKEVPSLEFRNCSQFGTCNPCDLKVKTDRFQKGGHASVEIVPLGLSKFR